jgi:hypothetical protein
LRSLTRAKAFVRSLCAAFHDFELEISIDATYRFLASR